MADLILIACFLAFCALCVAYVGWCDRIIGPDPAPSTREVTSPETVEV